MTILITMHRWSLWRSRRIARIAWRYRWERVSRRWWLSQRHISSCSIRCWYWHSGYWLGGTPWIHWVGCWLVLHVGGEGLGGVLHLYLRLRLSSRHSRVRCWSLVLQQFFQLLCFDFSHPVLLTQLKEFVLKAIHREIRLACHKICSHILYRQQ